jgi:DNA-binding response OmpR family regulator
MILQQHGYRVLVAEDGIEAIEVFQRERGRIDLVILDLTMPRLSGRDAFRELRSLDSEVRVLFASGFTHEQLSIEEQEQTVGFVAKPYRPRELATLVRQTLDRAAPSARV